MSSVLEILLADARTPSGSYAHSGGLEAAVAGSPGLTVGEVPSFIAARLRTVGRCDAALAAVAASASSVPELLRLDLETAARTPAEPLRVASGRLGRGLLRTALVWWPDDLLLQGYASSSSLTPRPVALGAVARAAGVSCEGAARVSLYDDAATVAAAAVKLMPLDSAVASGWLVALSSLIEELACAVSGPVADLSCAGVPWPPSTSAPLLDRRALVHASTERRLFAS
jgi:urease accessory protein